MDKLQFNINEDSLYSPMSPDVVDISSGSEDAFSIPPGDRIELEERFRINPAGSILMCAFVGAATASLFPNTDTSLGQDAVSMASGTQLEIDLMGLIGDLQQEQENSPTSFIDSEFEEGNLFPWTIGNEPDARTNSYGRPTARIPPTPKTSSNDRGILLRPTPVYPPNHRPGLANFQQPQANEPMEQGVWNDPNQLQQSAPGLAAGFNLSPMLFPFTVNATSHGIRQAPQPAQLGVQLGFPFSVTHSTNLMLIPAHERQSIRLIPSVMANVAGYCDLCGKCYDQIALETLGEYLVAAEYEGETVKEKAIRSRAFIHRWFRGSAVPFQKCGTVASLQMRWFRRATVTRNT